MSAAIYYFDSDKLADAARAFVEHGPVGTRALRQQEADGALNFLQSDAARKLRVEPSPAGGLRPPASVLAVGDEDQVDG